MVRVLSVMEPGTSRIRTSPLVVEGGSSICASHSHHSIRTESVKIRVLECCFRGDTSSGLQLDHLLQQVYRLFVEVLAQLADVFIGVAMPLRKSHLHLRKICKALPCFFARGTKSSENLKDLPDLRVSSKEGLLVGKFEKDSSNRPDIDSC